MGETDKNLEEATALALKYCNPDDSEIISDLDRHLREAAWTLLERINNLENQLTDVRSDINDIKNMLLKVLKDS